MDYSLSFIGLLIASPVLIVTGMAIKITSSGPVFYTQVRVGKDGRLFNIIKFRTMHADAESQTGPVWTKKNDSRITTIGKFLRETHIDELPQLINVLKGDMATIGPRPERPHFVDMLNNEIHGYTRRLAVKPGIAGLAQCYCKYDETITDVRRKLRYDVLYIKNKCWRLDVQIIWRTLSIGLLCGEHQIPRKLFLREGYFMERKERRSRRRRKLNLERRLFNDFNYNGPESRSMVYWRSGKDRRVLQV